MSRNSGNGGYSPYAVIIFILLLVFVAIWLFCSYVWIIIPIIAFFLWKSPKISLYWKIGCSVILTPIFFFSLIFMLEYMPK